MKISILFICLASIAQSNAMNQDTEIDFDIEDYIKISGALNHLQDGSNPLNAAAQEAFYDVCRHPEAIIEDPNLLEILQEKELVDAGQQHVSPDVAYIVRETILQDQEN